MEIMSNSENNNNNNNNNKPCNKVRKRSSSFANNNSLSQLLMDRSPACEEEETTTLHKSGAADDRIEKTITNVEKTRNKSRSSPGLVYVPEVINQHHGQSSNFMEKDKSYVGMPLNYDTKSFEENSQPYGEIKCHQMLKSIQGLEEIKHSLTVSKELLKLITHVWTPDSNHDHSHGIGISLASTLNHELNKARYHVNKLIQEQRPSHTSVQESKEQDKIRFAVKTVSQELETERKLRRQSERMNKKLGRELANTKSHLAKVVQKAESEKQATKILEELCEKMAHSIEEDRIELEELKKESERVRKEMEEEREMLRVADMLREERLQMKLIDAKYEYEDKHKQMNILVQDLEDLLEVDDDTQDITPKVLSWYQSDTYNKGEIITHSIWHENEKSETMNDENTLGDEARGLSWFENTNEVVNDQTISTQNEVLGRNSDCIELEFGFDMKNECEDLNECLEDKILGFASMKEYEDEMERYKMIKDLRDRIVSGGSDLSRETVEFGSYV